MAVTAVDAQSRIYRYANQGAYIAVAARGVSDHSHLLTLGAGRATINLDPFQQSASAQTSRTATDFESGPTGDTIRLQDFLTTWAGWDASETFVMKKRDKSAVLAFMKKALKRPEAIATDGLRSSVRHSAKSGGGIQFGL